MTDALPFLVSGGPPIRARFKARWEDFRVEEILARAPSGTGDHLWLEIEKRGLTTPRAAADLARRLGVKPSSVGYAGLKDARSVATQWLSVERVPPEHALAVRDPRITVLRAVPHQRKLRRGWHDGNRFEIRLRSVRAGVGGEEGPDDPVLGAAPLVAERLGRLGRVGVPNYYGPQRFGTRGDTWEVGRALAREAWDEAVSLIAGRPLRPDDPVVDATAGIHPDTGDILRARELFDAGEYGAAAGAWPRGFGQCARLAAAMERTGGDARRALPVVGKAMLRLYASAWQAWLFNRVLAARMPGIDRLMPGDLAWKHDSEALFEVADPDAERPRADAFEISPTGPLVGQRPRAPSGEAGALEAEALAAAGHEPAMLDSAALRPLTGRRRPLRFRVREGVVETGRDEDGDHLTLRFSLPPGCYATSVLRELGLGGIEEHVSGGAGGDDGP